MQPAAEMPGDCTPGHSVLRVAAAMRTPLPSRFRTFLSTFAVYHPATGRTDPLALPPRAARSPPIHAHTNATLNPLRIRTHLPRAEIACDVSCPHPPGRKRRADQASRSRARQRSSSARVIGRPLLARLGLLLAPVGVDRGVDLRAAALVAHVEVHDVAVGGPPVQADAVDEAAIEVRDATRLDHRLLCRLRALPPAGDVVQVRLDPLLGRVDGHALPRRVGGPGERGLERFVVVEEAEVDLHHVVDPGDLLELRRGSLHELDVLPRSAPRLGRTPRWRTPR